MRKVALSRMRDGFSCYLRLATGGEIVITRPGRPAGVLIGFRSEEDWFEYRIEGHPRLLARIVRAREAIRRGKGVRLEKLRD